MSERLGLAAEVPTGELCGKMVVLSALAEAFRQSAFVWCHAGSLKYIADRHDPSVANADVLRPAPTVREMLTWLDGREVVVDCDTELDELINGRNTNSLLYDPDALARACCEAATP